MQTDIKIGTAGDLVLTISNGVLSATGNVSQQLGLFKLKSVDTIELDASMAAKAIFDYVKSISPQALQGLEGGLEQIILSALAQAV